MADVHPSPGGAQQMPQAASAGSAPVPYSGPDLLGQPYYMAELGPLGEPSGEVLDGIAPMSVIHESPAAHDISAGLADAPYYPGPLSPIATIGDGDADDVDDVAGTVQGAVGNATARWQMHMADAHAGSVIGDLMTLPPNPLDPGVGSLGTTDPAGAYYDPPRNY